jgi:hypothetical protein
VSRPVTQMARCFLRASLFGALTLVMTILHQMPLARQDNHATNHARCTKMRKSGQSRRHIEAKPGESCSSQTCVENNACQAKHWYSNAYRGSMLTGEAPLLGTGARDANRQERMIRADFIPALCCDWPIMSGRIMQGRPEGGGSFGNGLLHSRPRVGGL